MSPQDVRYDEIKSPFDIWLCEVQDIYGQKVDDTKTIDRLYAAYMHGRSPKFAAHELCDPPAAANPLISSVVIGAQAGLCGFVLLLAYCFFAVWKSL